MENESRALRLVLRPQACPCISRKLALRSELSGRSTTAKGRSAAQRAESDEQTGLGEARARPSAHWDTGLCAQGHGPQRRSAAPWRTPGRRGNEGDDARAEGQGAALGEAWHRAPSNRSMVRVTRSTFSTLCPRRTSPQRGHSSVDSARLSKGHRRRGLSSGRDPAACDGAAAAPATAAATEDVLRMRNGRRLGRQALQSYRGTGQSYRGTLSVSEAATSVTCASGSRCSSSLAQQTPAMAGAVRHRCAARLRTALPRRGALRAWRR